jgi:hypothetical protein
MKRRHYVQVSGTEFWVKITTAEVEALKEHCEKSKLNLTKDVRYPRAMGFAEIYWVVDRKE